jgi:hypothetical protein
VGPELYVRSEMGWGDFVAMARYLRKGQESPVIASTRGRKIDGKPNYHGLDVKSLEKKGKFRIVRNGPMVHFFMAEGKDDQFREVCETEFGTNDIDMVRLAAIFGGSEHEHNILWHELTIRAEALPGWVDRKSLGGSGPSSSGWMD